VPGTSNLRRNDWPTRPARKAALAVSGLSLLALVAAFANGLPLLVRIPIALLVVAMGARTIRRLVHPSINGLRIEGFRVCVRTASGPRHCGKLAGSPFVSPFYVGFRWREDDRMLPHSLGIFREQMDATDFRRLCATLRQQGQGS